MILPTIEKLNLIKSFKIELLLIINEIFIISSSHNIENFKDLYNDDNFEIFLKLLKNLNQSSNIYYISKIDLMISFLLVDKNDNGLYFNDEPIIYKILSKIKY